MRLRVFDYIQSMDELKKLYCTNGDKVQLNVEKELYDELWERQTVVFGCVEWSKPIYAVIMKKEQHPREQYAMDDSEFVYTVRFKLLVDMKLELLEPNFSYHMEEWE